MHGFWELSKCRNFNIQRKVDSTALYWRLGTTGTLQKWDRQKYSTALGILGKSLYSKQFR